MAICVMKSSGGGSKMKSLWKGATTGNINIDLSSYNFDKDLFVVRYRVGSGGQTYQACRRVQEPTIACFYSDAHYSNYFLRSNGLIKNTAGGSAAGSITILEVLVIKGVYI